MDTMYQNVKQNYALRSNYKMIYEQMIRNSNRGSHLGKYDKDSSTSESYMKMIPPKVNQNYSLN